MILPTRFIGEYVVGFYYYNQLGIELASTKHKKSPERFFQTVQEIMGGSKAEYPLN